MCFGRLGFGTASGKGGLSCCALIMACWMSDGRLGLGKLMSSYEKKELFSNVDDLPRGYRDAYFERLCIPVLDFPNRWHVMEPQRQFIEVFDAVC